MVEHGQMANVIIDNSDLAMPGVIKFHFEPSVAVHSSVRTRGAIRIPAGTDAIGTFVRAQAARLGAAALADLTDPSAVEFTLAENHECVRIAFRPFSSK